MSFLNRIGLGFLDPTNELDKFANAIKDGDVSEIVEKIGNLFQTVEDRLEDIAEIFEARVGQRQGSDGRSATRCAARDETRGSRHRSAGRRSRSPRRKGCWATSCWTLSRRRSRKRSCYSWRRSVSRKRKKPVRGSEFSVSLPTEPMAGAAKTEPVMAVMVQDDGVQILDYELTLGASIAFRVGGAVKAFMERVGPAPDSDIKMIAGSGNAEPVTVEYEHALAGAQNGDAAAGRATEHQRRRVATVGDDRAKLGRMNGDERRNRG